jgi:hypothetical protein
MNLLKLAVAGYTLAGRINYKETGVIDYDFIKIDTAGYSSSSSSPG